MKTKRNGIAILAIVALVGLALWVQRQGRGGTNKSQPAAPVVSAEGPGGASDFAKNTEAAAKVSGEELTPEMMESLTTATAQVIRGDGHSQNIRALDREFEQLLVEPNEILKIRVALKDCQANQTVRRHS